MSDRVPEILKPMLLEYERRLRNTLEKCIYGVYLYNSIALGAFENDRSDIDFITVLNRELTEAEIKKLRALHRELKRKYRYASRLEGMYIVKEELGKVRPEIKPHIFYDHGRLHSYGYHNINYVTWHTLKYSGIGVNSPDIGGLIKEITRENLIEAMEYNLNCYWRKKLDSKLIFLTDYMIEFAVLTLCRILYTLEQGEIVPKCKAAEYELVNIPDSLKIIVQEALRIRRGTFGRSLYSSKIKRQKDVKSFINYIIGYCNHKYGLA